MVRRSVGGATPPSVMALFQWIDYCQDKFLCGRQERRVGSGGNSSFWRLAGGQVGNFAYNFAGGQVGDFAYNHLDQWPHWLCSGFWGFVFQQAFDGSVTTRNVFDLRSMRPINACYSIQDIILIFILFICVHFSTLLYLQVLGCGPESEGSSNLSAKAEAPGYISVIFLFARLSLQLPLAE